MLHEAEELTPAERSAFAVLTREHLGSAELEDRVVDSLRDRGLLYDESPAWRASRWWRGVASVAVGVVLFATGVLVGRQSHPATLMLGTPDAAGTLLDTVRPARVIQRPAGATALRSDPARLGLWIGCAVTCSAVYDSLDGSMVFNFTEPPVVNFVAAGGPADRAGVRLNDTIWLVNGVSITTAYGGKVFSRVSPGEQLTLRLRHGADTRTVALTTAR